jgi:crotonobetainyl-CoA:carnitine CoA-transferase CaiB-like acyl-CoA transferase
VPSCEQGEPASPAAPSHRWLASLFPISRTCKHGHGNCNTHARIPLTIGRTDAGKCSVREEGRDRLCDGQSAQSARAQQVLEKLVKWADVLIVNTPHPARKRLKLQYDDVVQWNPRLIYADVTGFGDKGPDSELPGFDITAYWARSGLLSKTRDAGAPPTWPMAASGDHASAVGLFSAIVMGLYRRERTGKGSYVTTSLLAEGVWAAGVSIAGALAGATFYPLHDRQSPSNATLNPYKTSDGSWFMLVVTPDKFPALATGIGRPDL